jgi:hypothetical protein
MSVDQLRSRIDKYLPKGLSLILGVALTASCSPKSGSPTVEVTGTNTPTRTPTATATSTPDMQSTIDAAVVTAVDGRLTQLAPTLTRTATKTPEPTSTLAPTPLGGIAECQPFDSLNDLSVAQTDGLDWRDAWNALTGIVLDKNGNHIVSLIEEQSAKNSVECFVRRGVAGYESGMLVKGHLTTIEKLAELMGVDPKDLAKNPKLGMEFVHINDLRLHSSEVEKLIAADNGLGIVTSVENFSETIVKLSENLASAARAKLGPDARVNDPKVIANGIFADFAEEGVWKPGIDPRLVDEIRRMCFTVRGNADTRINQPEITVPALWKDGVKAGEGTLVNNVWELSNENGLLVAADFVNAQELTHRLESLALNNHQATVVEVAQDYFVILQVFDVNTKVPNDPKVLNISEAQQFRHGGQLIWCAESANVVTNPVALPTGTKVFVIPTVPTHPEASSTVRPTPAETPVASATPRPTQPEASPTFQATPNPTSTAQETIAPPTEMSTPHDGTPTQGPSVTDTATPQLPTMTPQPQGSPTAWTP